MITLKLEGEEIAYIKELLSDLNDAEDDHICDNFCDIPQDELDSSNEMIAFRSAIIGKLISATKGSKRSKRK